MDKNNNVILFNEIYSDSIIKKEKNSLNKNLNGFGFSVDICRTDEWYEGKPMFEARVVDSNGDEVVGTATGRYCSLKSVIDEIEAIVSEFIANLKEK